MSTPPGTIRTGIGGWVFPAWRGGTFYPAGLPQREELAYASQQLGCIEINSTFYRAQKPAIYAQWREQTPEGFRFSAKAPRTITQTHDLTTVGERAERFIDGIRVLEDRLGPLIWQFGDSHPAGAAEFEQFLGMLRAGSTVAFCSMHWRYATRPHGRRRCWPLPAPTVQRWYSVARMSTPASPTRRRGSPMRG